MNQHSNIAASVRQRLLNRARERGEEFNLVLTRFGIERLLYRIGISSKAPEFCLKGAQLFAAWTGEVHRATRDADFLSSGSSQPEDVASEVREVLLETERAPGTDDGLIFEVESVTAEEIREDQEYGGVRVKLIATLAGARIPLQLDVGFGDAITPDTEELTLPTLLDFPAPTLIGYPMPTVIAEKVEALTTLGIANSRMKDFYDLWVIARKFEPDMAECIQAVQNTFKRRETAIHTEPIGLTVGFWEDEMVVARWNAFARKSLLVDGPPSISELLKMLRAFLLPVLSVADRNQTSALPRKKWLPEDLAWVGCDVR